MGAGVDVLRVAFESGAVAGFGLVEFALLEIDVAELGVMMRLVEVVNLGLQLLDAAAVEGARQLESARGRGRGAIDRKVIEQGGDAPADEDEQGPKPFPPADGVNEHPELEQGKERQSRRSQPQVEAEQTRNERSEHVRQTTELSEPWQGWQFVEKLHFVQSRRKEAQIPSENQGRSEPANERSGEKAPEYGALQRLRHFRRAQVTREAFGVPVLRRTLRRVDGASRRYRSRDAKPAIARFIGLMPPLLGALILLTSVPTF